MISFLGFGFGHWIACLLIYQIRPGFEIPWILIVGMQGLGVGFIGRR